MTKKEFSLTSNECRALWRKIAYNSEDCDADSSVVRENISTIMIVLIG